MDNETLRKKRIFITYGVSDFNNEKVTFNKGRYPTRDAAGAAKKVFNQICRLNNIKTGTLIIAVKEITRNSNKKVYTYTAERYKLKNPKVFKKGTPGEFTIQYDTKVISNKTFKFDNDVKVDQ